MTSDMMGDAMDDMAGEDGEEEETDELVGQVLDEIGVSLGQDLVAAPGVKNAATAVRTPAAAEPAAEAMGAGGGGGSAPPPQPPRAAAPPPPPPPAAASGSGAAAPPPPPPPPPAEGPGLDDDLQARLDALRKG